MMIFELLNFCTNDTINKFSHDVAPVAFCGIVTLNIAFGTKLLKYLETVKLPGS